MTVKGIAARQGHRPDCRAVIEYRAGLLTAFDANGVAV